MINLWETIFQGKALNNQRVVVDFKYHPHEFHELDGIMDQVSN